LMVATSKVGWAERQIATRKSVERGKARTLAIIAACTGREKPSRGAHPTYNRGRSVMIRPTSFDQISVISDLHMGGPEGRQIFRQGKLLERFIEHLRVENVGKSALVINGDMVDFLAQTDARCFDPEGAVRKLEKIASEEAFRGVWQGLTEFVQTPDRYLAITLGNHDLELALPWVRERLLELLSGGDPAARARILLSFDGAGFACQAGGANVLCLHGNEVDTWNVTDYERLRRITCDIVQGRLPGEWNANAGTKLVVDVMNHVKSQHAFVDLLKPEKEAAVRLLLVLRPEFRPALRQVAGIAARRLWDAARREMRLLSDPATPEERAEEDALVRIAGRGAYVEQDVKTLLDAAEAQFLGGEDPLDLVYGEAGAQLGWWSALVSAVRGRAPHEIAWSAVKELASDETFRIRRIDGDFEAIDKLAGSVYDVVIAGHTHLARVVGRQSKGVYYNSGTWASLMRLRPEQLKSADAFKPVFEALRDARTIQELEEQDLVLRRPTVVRVGARNGKVEHGLHTVALVDEQITLSEAGD
jgi:UDP-2,3-diacylglucosamine pyrophosphatase LpxH